VLGLFVLVDLKKMHFVFQDHEVDFYVETMHGNIYEIQLARNFLQLNVIYVDDQVHVYVNVEYKAKNIHQKMFIQFERNHSTYFRTFRCKFHFNNTRCWSFP
jgi:hypothetical protein